MAEKNEPCSKVVPLSQETAKETGELTFMKQNVVVSVTVHHVYFTHGYQCPEPMNRELRKDTRKSNGARRTHKTPYVVLILD